jgi:hypothetical protein
MDVYILNNDGSVTKDGVIVSVGGDYHGWNLNSDKWMLSGSQADLNGLFYSSNDVEIGGGSVGDLSVSVLSEGNISLTGNGEYTAYYEDCFAISLQDVDISGTPQGNPDLGVIYAREQVSCLGDASVRGVVIAADLDCASNLVTSNVIGASFFVEYNGGFSTNIPLINPQDYPYKFDPTFCAYEER